MQISGFRYRLSNEERIAFSDYYFPVGGGYLIYGDWFPDDEQPTDEDYVRGALAQWAMREELPPPVTCKWEEVNEDPSDGLTQWVSVELDLLGRAEQIVLILVMSFKGMQQSYEVQVISGLPGRQVA